MKLNFTPFLKCLNWTLLLLVSTNVFAQSKAIADTKSETFTINLNSVGLSPQAHIEGYQYVLEAFDILNENELAIVGTRDTIHFIKKIDLNTGQLIADLTLEDTPLEIIGHDGKIIILGDENLSVIDQNNQIRSKKHNIDHYSLFNKMLELNGQVYLYMSNGSAYQIEDLNPILYNKIPMGDKPIWIEKQNPKEFIVEIGQDTYTYDSDTELGSMTILGNVGDKPVFVIEKIIQTYPLILERMVGSPLNEFANSEVIKEIPEYSYYKNDLRCKDGKLYQLNIDENNLTITAKPLAL